MPNLHASYAPVVAPPRGRVHLLTDEDDGDAMDMVAAYAAIPNVRSHLRTMLATSQTALLPLEQDRVKGADGEARGATSRET